MKHINEVEELVQVDKDIIRLAFELSDEMGVRAYRDAVQGFKDALQQTEGVKVFPMNVIYRTYITKLLNAVLPLLEEEQKPIFFKAVIL